MEGRCLSIMRLESGSMDELVDLFLKTLRNTTVPSGTVVLIGSISHLAWVGVHGYSSACINAKRSVSGAIKGFLVIPFIPPPPWVAAMTRGHKVNGGHLHLAGFKSRVCR